MTAPATPNQHESPDERPQRDRGTDDAPDRAHIRREALHIALVLGALTALLAIAVGAAHFDLGPLSPALAMMLSAIKALLVATIFMRLAREPGVVRLFAAAGLLWLTILFTLALADYQTRPARREPTGATGRAEAPPPSASREVPAARTPPDHP